jgi:DNA-binding NarL/FixJ family response regulator
MEVSDFNQKVELIFKQLQDCVREYIESELKTNHIALPRTFGLFTRREREVLPLIARCYSNKEIAAALNISERTVKFHVASILRKTGALSKTDLVFQCQEAARVP